MAKPAPYMLRWSPSHQVYELVDREHTTAFDLSDKHVAACLQKIPSFAFDGRMGAYTARKETRQRGESYWYAYRKREGKLTKKYLGKTAELTLARLEEVGQIVSAELVTQASASKAFPSPLSKDAHMVNKAREDKMVGDAELSPPSSHLPKQARDPFLATRLQRPRLRPRLVHRSRLNQRLALIPLSTLTLISAPAGYGKTTLVSDWLATSGIEVAWLSLKPEDNDPARFWNYIIAALETLHPGVGAEAWAMLQSGGLLPFVPLLTLLMNNLNQITRDFVLVLEDYHVIVETAIHEALSFLLNNLPHTTHFVMISRTMPPLHLAHLRVRGQLLELQTSDLRFSPEESAVFFSEVMDLPLSRDDLQKVEKRTEGWIAGLQLAALSMQNHPDISGFITRFAGDHRYIFDYLIEEVLWRQPAPLQEFLLHTCILEQLSGSLCDALTGRRDSFAILTQLETAQLFLMPLDDQRRWYRYHSLFADSLRAYLTQTTPELPNRLHRSASSWYEENGLLTHAIHHALQAAEYERAVILVEQLAPELLARGEVHNIFEWIESLPAEYVVARSGLCLYGAWGYLVLGKLDYARKMLEQAELVGIEPSMRTEAAAIQIAFAPYHGNAIDATLLAREVVNEYEALNTSLKRRSLFALQGAVAILKMQGRLRSAATICQQALAATRGVSLDTWAATGRTASAFMLGDILYELNDLGAAERLAKEAIDLCEKAPNDEVKAYSYGVLARIQQAQSDTPAALSLIQTAITIIRKRGMADEIAFLTAWQARIWLAQKRYQDAFAWAEANTQYAQAEPDYTREHVPITLARISLVQGNIAHALQLLKRVYEMASHDGRIRTVAEILVLRALAYQSQHDDVAALAELKQALMYAEPEGYMRLFVDEGQPMAQLLARLLVAERSNPEQSRSLSAYITTLLDAFIGVETSAIKSAPPAHTEPLTDREIEVLRLLATGASNRAIANQLVIALGTVKKHLNTIFIKLRAGNRMQAIVRARTLKLL